MPGITWIIFLMQIYSLEAISRRECCGRRSEAMPPQFR